MNVLSCFDGCSGGQLALQKATIKVDNYYASEIDKYAIKVTQSNFPNTIQVGDITNYLANPMYLQGRDVPKIDLIMGGSPCQGFSFAGKNLNFTDPRSKLFFEFIRLKNGLNPKYFLLENVKMKKESMDIITKYMGVEPIEINSSLLSAQNRKRLYWTNIPFDADIKDKGLVLKDILEPEENIEPKYLAGNNLIINYRGGNQLNPTYKSQANTIHDTSKKSPCVCAGTHGYAIGYVERCLQVGAADLKGYDIIKRVYSVEGKSPALTTMQGGHREPKIMRGVSAINRKQRYWRKLTPLECERLQTIPDNYTNHVSNSQRYKMIGNGWTVDVIAHILKGIQ